MTETIDAHPHLANVATTTIRDLVEAYPETMAVMGPLGIDLCCGGAHTLGEALDLHRLNREEVLRQIGRVLGPRAGSEG